jgi:hypothetical protein
LFEWSGNGFCSIIFLWIRDVIDVKIACFDTFTTCGTWIIKINEWKFIL